MKTEDLKLDIKFLKENFPVPNARIQIDLEIREELLKLREEIKKLKHFKIYVSHVEELESRNKKLEAQVKDLKEWHKAGLESAVIASGEIKRLEDNEDVIADDNHRLDQENIKLRKALKDALKELRHTTVFIATREKMHKDGILLHIKLITKLEKIKEEVK